MCTTFIAIAILHIFMCTVFVHSGKFLNGYIGLAMNTEVWCTSFSAFVILYSLFSYSHDQPPLAALSTIEHNSRSTNKGR